MAIPSTLMLIFDWWAFEILAVIAGYISIEVTGAYVITANCYYFFVMFCTGTQLATCVQVGKAMGEGNPLKAKRYVKLTFFYAALMTSILATFIIGARQQIAVFFTDQLALIELINLSIGLMALVIIIHGGSMGSLSDLECP